MISKKENITDFFGTAIFLVLFSLFVGCYTHSPEPTIRKDVKISMTAGLQTNQTALNNFQQINCQHSLIPLLDKSYIRLTNQDNRHQSDNLKNNQQFSSQKKVENRIAPQIHLRQFRQPLHYTSEDITFLS